MDERMDAPNGKRIVELLRKAAKGSYEGEKGRVMDNIAQLIGCYGAMDYRTIDKLADMVEEAIQHEHESAYDAGYDAGFESADDWCAQHEDAMAEHGWYRALDADKKPVCIGAAMDSDHYEDGTVVGLQFFNTANKNLRVLIAIRPHGWDTPTWRDPESYRHHKQPTVEDVLREMLDKWGEMPSNMTNEAIVAEYAAKLQLRGDAE